MRWCGDLAEECCQCLVGAFVRTKIGVREPPVGVENSHNANLAHVEALVDGLVANDHINFPLVKERNGALECGWTVRFI